MRQPTLIQGALWLSVFLSAAIGAHQFTAADEATGPSSKLELPEPVQAEVHVEKSTEALQAENMNYNIPILIGSKKQGLVQITPKEEAEINQLLRQDKKLGLIRFASILAAKGEGFNDFTWRNVYMVYGANRRGECRVKIQKSLYFRDIVHCAAVSQVRSIQYAYIKYNNWDIGFDRFITVLERSAQIIGLALPLSLRN